MVSGMGQESVCLKDRENVELWGHGKEGTQAKFPRFSFFLLLSGFFQIQQNCEYLHCVGINVFLISWWNGRGLGILDSWTFAEDRDLKGPWENRSIYTHDTTGGPGTLASLFMVIQIHCRISVLFPQENCITCRKNRNLQFSNFMSLYIVSSTPLKFPCYKLYPPAPPLCLHKIHRTH